ncbi:MAG: ATPase P [Planctomycetes bacterium]|nr:ATPase P [Planctomycetota bacterium]
MLEIDVPGYKGLVLGYLVLDFNGTLAVDGLLLAGVKERLAVMGEDLEIHVVTADTFGSVREELAGIGCRVAVLKERDQVGAKGAYVLDLGAEHVVGIGNGRNDRMMLKEAELGIALMQAEGAASSTVLAADMVCGSILDGLDLLIHPTRLVAGLRK